jgi:hypothetical protein
MALAALLLLSSRVASAHPAPFSFLDLVIREEGIDAVLVLHVVDVAHDLGIEPAERLLDANEAARLRDRVVALIQPRLQIRTDAAPTFQWLAFEPAPDRHAVVLRFRVVGSRPGVLRIQTRMFPYDPVHQTFINIYEDSALKLQAILDASHQDTSYYSGSTQGRWAVVKTFVLSGIEHILIGPDHILFLVGLLLLGGTFARLTLIVTSFTIGHSITLSLAALDIVSPPARFIEPLIALTIIVVGADNLLVLRSRRHISTLAEALANSAPREADIRAWLAVAFGLIHGFGFAYVLKEFGLPQAALGWSLFAFNLGVEIGQLLIVVVVAGVLLIVRRRSPALAGQAALLGSIAVIGAGAYWFLQRVFFPA